MGWLVLVFCDCVIWDNCSDCLGLIGYVGVY